MRIWRNYSYIVTEARTLDGMGHTARTTYVYANGCWDHNGQPCYNPNGSGESKTLAGYGQVTVDQYDYNSAKLSQQVYFFHLDYQRLGRSYRVQTYASDGTLAAQNDTFWGTQAAYRGTLTYAGQILQTTYDGGLPATTRTDYTYDAFGNITAEYQYGAEERVRNGGFEADAEHWNYFWEATPASISQDTAYAGIRSLKLQSTSTGGGAWQDIYGLQSGETYAVRVWIKGVDIGSARFRLWLHDAGDPVVYSKATDVTPGINWQLVTLMYTANATGKVRVHLQLLPGSGTIYVDAVSVSRVSDASDERTILTNYVQNTSPTVWLIGLKARQTVHAGIVPNSQGWVDIVFPNDYNTQSADRNLYVDYIMVGDQQIQAEDPQVRYDLGVGKASFDGDAVRLGQETMAWNGALRIYFLQFPSSPIQIRIRARGSYAEGWPEMRLRVNGVGVATWTVNNSNWGDYSVNINIENASYPATQNFLYYDDTSYDVQHWGLSNALTRGELHMMGQGILGSTPFVTTTYAYDAWGNLTQETDPNGNVTTSTYDSTYHQFPIQSCTTSGHCNYTYYYGVNPDAAVSGGYGLFGQIQSTRGMQYVWEWEPGPPTGYSYDAFGRLVKEARPGDSLASPTSRYVYHEPLSVPAVSNPGFESSLSGPWSEYDPSNIQAYTRDSTQAYAGTKSLKIVTTSTADHWVGQYLSGWQAGQTYQIRAYVKTTASGQLCLNLAAKTGHEAQAVCRTATGGWELLVGTVTLPADATHFLLLLRTPVGTVYVDEVYVTSLYAMSAYAKEDAAGNTLWQRQVYDGLGRALQTQTEYNGAQATVVDQRYDALGRVVAQSVPYLATSSVNAPWYSAPDTAQATTHTQYDTNGLTVRAPDGSTTLSYQVGRVSMSVDANGHRRDQLSDAFGNMVQVYEYNNDPQTYEAEAAGCYHQVGSAGSGVWLSPAVGTGGGYLTYGPYQTPGAAGVGQMVLFRLAIDTVSGVNDVVARIEVNDVTANHQIFASREIRRSEFVGGLSNFSEFALTFDTSGRSGHSLEYRVLWYGLAQMAHDRTRLLWTVNRNSTQYTYDTLGNLLTVTDALGNVTSMLYDKLSRKTSMTDPDMGQWYYYYDNAGNLIAQVDARQQAINFYYDNLNRLRGKTYATTTTPATYSRPVDPGYNGYTVTYTYDAGTYGIDRRTGMSMSDNSSSASWTYDGRGRVTQETKTISGQSFSTSYTYDPMDRVVTTTYPDNEVVRNTYNTAGQPATLRSDTYSYNYVSSASYNALGQITQMNLGNGTLTRWGYRGLGGNWDTPPTAGLTGYGRLYRIRTTAPSGEPWLDLRYGYDAVGNVTRMLDVSRQAANWPTSGFTFQDTFDSKNTTNWTWSTHQTVPYSDGGNNVVRNVGTGSNYDANFYRSAYSLVNGKGLQLRFKVNQTDTTAVFAIEANDSTYRRFGVIANEGKLYVQYRDDGATWRSPADILTNLQVNTWYVLRIVVDDSGRGFYLEAYQENAPTVRGSYNIGMPTGKSWRFHHWIYRGTAYLDDYREFNTSGLNWTPDERMGFTYDALDRLVGASPVNGGQGYNQTYSYNQIGNLMTRDAFVYTYNAPKPGSGCSAGTPNTKPHAVQSVTSLGSFTYDCNGNMLNRVENGVSYTQGWNQENRLQTVTVNGATTTFTYDGDGVLVKKTVSGSDGYSTYYVGPHYEKTITASNVVTATKYYYFGSQRAAMRVCTGTNGSCGTNGATSTLTYLHGDHLGSASLSTNASGGKVSEMRYYPYGETRNGSMPTDRRYTGQREEIGLGLYDYNARHYDPALGRFLQADSIVPSSQNPQSLNRYSYVLNSPLRYTDPTGHCAADRSDPDCWDVYDRVTGKLNAGANGFNVTDLWIWDTAALLGLEGWVDRGIMFLGNWHADAVGIVIQVLDAIQTSLGDTTNTALGLNHGPLTYRKGIDDVALGAGIAGRSPFDWKNQIAFASATNLTPELVLHETGHLVDWHINNENGLWSDKNFIPGQYTRDRFLGFLWRVGERKYRGNPLDAPSSTSSPVEDFADTFAWRVMTNPNSSIGLPNGWNPASPGRQNDLNRGLDSLTVQANP